MENACLLLRAFDRVRVERWRREKDDHDRNLCSRKAEVQQGRRHRTRGVERGRSMPYERRLDPPCKPPMRAPSVTTRNETAFCRGHALVDVPEWYAVAHEFLTGAEVPRDERSKRVVVVDVRPELRRRSREVLRDRGRRTATHARAFLRKQGRRCARERAAIGRAQSGDSQRPDARVGSKDARSEVIDHGSGVRVDRSARQRQDQRLHEGTLAGEIAIDRVTAETIVSILGTTDARANGRKPLRRHSSSTYSKGGTSIG